MTTFAYWICVVALAPTGALPSGPPDVRDPVAPASTVGTTPALPDTSSPGGPVPSSTPLVKPAPMRAAGYYLHIAPGVISFGLPAPDFFGYVWGVGAGRFIPLRQRLAIAVGGFLEHLVVPAFNKYTRFYHLPRIGAELRVGRSNARVFGYGLARLGLDLIILTHPASFGEVQALTSLGGGVQGALGPRGRLLLGAEPSVDVSLPTPWLMLRTRVFLGIRF